MDLYRYFHPHHHPRLRKVSLRHQEIEELLQAAVELRRALGRARTRNEQVAVEGIEGEHFDQIFVAVDYVIDSLSQLSHAHPGDTLRTTLDLVEERKEIPGWEIWAELVKNRLQSAISDSQIMSDQEERKQSEKKQDQENLVQMKLSEGIGERVSSGRFDNKQSDNKSNDSKVSSIRINNRNEGTSESPSESSFGALGSFAGEDQPHRARVAGILK
jgi:hypothetical protein